MRGISTLCIQQQCVLNEQAMANAQPTTNIDIKFLRRKMVEDLTLFIKSLQEEGHVIVLGIDANETVEESLQKDEPKEGSIAWLLTQTELEEVFYLRHQEVPDSTTMTPGRFIDCVAVYGITVQRVTPLHAHEPAKSHHLGVAVDLDLRYLFSNACSPLVQPQPRKLTSGNSKAVQKYVEFIKKKSLNIALWIDASDCVTLATKMNSLTYIDNSYIHWIAK